MTSKGSNLTDNKMSGTTALLILLGVVVIAGGGILYLINRVMPGAPKESPKVSYVSLGNEDPSKKMWNGHKPTASFTITNPGPHAATTSSPAKIFTGTFKDGKFVWDGPGLKAESPVYVVATYKAERRKNLKKVTLSFTERWEAKGPHGGELPELPDDATGVKFTLYGWK